MDFIGYWIERAKQTYDQLDYSELDEKTRYSLIYAASHLVSELEKAANKTDKKHLIGGKHGRDYQTARRYKGWE